MRRLQEALPKYAEYFEVDDRSKLSPGKYE